MTTDLHDVDALTAELEKITAQGWEWGQGPGTEYFRTVERELEEARRVAELPILNVTYSGPGILLLEGPNGTWETTWKVETLSGAFKIARRLGSGSSIVAMILENGHGKSWLCTQPAQVTVVPDPS